MSPRSERLISQPFQENALASKRNYSIAYISGISYPSPAASALQGVQMAAAFARHTAHTHLYVSRMAISETEMLRNYGASGPLSISSPRVGRAAALALRSRSAAYNTAVALRLAVEPRWRQPGQRRVIFVRNRKEGLYWGMMRRYFWWLKGWIFVYELHELYTSGQNGDIGEPDWQSPRVLKTLRALPNYDLVLTLTHNLAEDIRNFSPDRVNFKVMPGCSGLQRLDGAPTIRFSPDRVTLGYLGTVDRSHGIDELFEALPLLPERCILRIIGHVPEDHTAWFEQHVQSPQVAGRVEWKPRVAYAQVAEEIDACDIVLAPAGETLLSHRYRSPLKLFDYMVRGKPIVASGVPSHREILRDGENALLYSPHNRAELAARIASLIDQPWLAEKLARAAWEQSAPYTYDQRAQRILDLLDEIAQK